MSAPDLQQLPPDVDVNRIGISYSGGGPLLLVELGVAQAFVDLGIRPVAIAGVSAGAIAGTAHAYDPDGGTAIKAAADALLTLSDHKLGLNKGEVLTRVLASLTTSWKLPASLGDNSPLKPLIQTVFHNLKEPKPVTVAFFQAQNGRNRARLFIGATDIVAGEREWFDDPNVEIADGLVASSAIPGIFPPHPMRTADGGQKVFVDGAVAQNQPISALVARASCGTIYACAVGYDGGQQSAPSDALDNVMKSISILSHEFSRLEQAYVELMFKSGGLTDAAVHHVHPWNNGKGYAINGFNFTADMIQTVMSEACEETKTWIRNQGLMPRERATPSPEAVGVSGQPGRQ